MPDVFSTDEEKLTSNEGAVSDFESLTRMNDRFGPDTAKEQAKLDALKKEIKPTIESIGNKPQKQNDQTDIVVYETTKYNNGDCLDIEDIPEHEREIALTEFSEGSSALRNCLDILWHNSLPTYACCKGEHLQMRDSDPELLSVGYIFFARETDIFS